MANKTIASGVEAISHRAGMGKLVSCWLLMVALCVSAAKRRFQLCRHKQMLSGVTKSENPVGRVNVDSVWDSDLVATPKAWTHHCNSLAAWRA